MTRIVLPPEKQRKVVLRTVLADIPALVTEVERTEDNRVFYYLKLDLPVPHPHFGRVLEGDFAREFCHVE